MSNVVWDEYKKFCKERGRAMNRAAGRFGLIRTTIGFFWNFMYWLMGTGLFAAPLFLIWGFKIVWYMLVLLYDGIVWLIHKLFPQTAVAGHGSKKASGEEYERYVAEKLEEKGFYNVRLTPSSGDYGVDILAEKGGVKFAFQCKHYSHPVGVKAVQEIYAGCRKYGMERPVVVANTRFTPNAETLADDLGVSLWELEMFDAIF